MLPSPRTSTFLAQKYFCLPRIINKLDPATVGNIFKNCKNPHAFFPALGIFSLEFSLGYCHNMHASKKAQDCSVATTRRNPKRKWIHT